MHETHMIQWPMSNAHLAHVTCKPFSLISINVHWPMPLWNACSFKVNDNVESIFL